MVVIEVQKEDRAKVFELLLNNGRFRAIGENKFDIVDKGEAVIKKIEAKGIPVKIIDSNISDEQQ